LHPGPQRKAGLPPKNPDPRVKTLQASPYRPPKRAPFQPPYFPLGVFLRGNR